MRLRRKGRSERSKIVRGLDDVTRAIVKLRDQRICQKCNRRVQTREGCHWAHYKGRRDFRFRWDLWNSMVLDCGHHRYLDGHPDEFESWFRRRFPGRHAHVMQQKQLPRKTIRTVDLKERLEIYRALYKVMLELDRGRVNPLKETKELIDLLQSSDLPTTPIIDAMILVLRAHDKSIESLEEKSHGPSLSGREKKQIGRDAGGQRQNDTGGVQDYNEGATPSRGDLP